MNRIRTMVSRLMLLFLVAFPCARLSAQEGESQGLFQGVMGTEYFLAFPQNGDEQRQPNLRFLGVVITSQMPTAGTIEYPVGKNDWETRSFSTTPGQATVIELPGTLEQPRSEEIGRGGVHIVSRDPVAVFALNSRYLSGGGYAALPVNFWRNKYLPLAFPHADGDRNSTVTIVSAYDNTLVEITPSSRLYTKAAGEKITLSLKRGETYMFQAFKDPTKEYSADLSGSEIVSLNHPIGVISGHVRTPITYDGTYSIVEDYASHHAAMILPDELWGSDFYSVPSRPEGDRFRVISSGYNTTITIDFYKPDGGFDRSESVTLNRGEVFDTKERNLRVDGPVHWSATRPVMVMQYRTGRRYTSTPDPKAGSPGAFALTPSDMYSQRTMAASPVAIRGNNFSQSLSLVVKSSNGDDPFDGVSFDGTPLRTAFPGLSVRRIGSTPYYYAVDISIPSGGHVLTTENGHALAGALYGGTSGGDGYAWTLPYWMPQVSADVRAPYLKEEPSGTSGKGVVAIDVSDRTDVYFSGVKEVRVIDSPGWERVSYNGAITIDDDASATFRAVSDPSGVLKVELCDNAGNCRVVEFPSVCFRTALADRNAVSIVTTQGRAKSDSVILLSNICLDKANIKSMELENKNDFPFLSVRMGDGGNVPFSLEGGAQKSIVLTVSESAPRNDPNNLYRTRLRIVADDSSIVIPVEVLVNGPTSVEDEAVAGAFAASVYPNPFVVSTSIGFGRPLGRSASVTIADPAGTVVRSYHGSELAGRTKIEWDGSAGDGGALPSGLYLITISDGADRLFRGVTLVR